MDDPVSRLLQFHTGRTVSCIGDDQLPGGHPFDRQSEGRKVGVDDACGEPLPESHQSIITAAIGRLTLPLVERGFKQGPVLFQHGPRHGQSVQNFGVESAHTLHCRDRRVSLRERSPDRLHGIGGLAHGTDYDGKAHFCLCYIREDPAHIPDRIRIANGGTAEFVNLPCHFSDASARRAAPSRRPLSHSLLTSASNDL